MRNSAETSAFLRPMRSPKWPQMMPPTGRARNPTANELNAASVPMKGSAPGKNAVLRTSAAAVP